jgi:hypothetical protein
LLGKKSWNVYNTENIERVKRDEAEAKAKEEAEEQRIHELDAARRLAILRGENPPPLPADEAVETQEDRRHRSRHGDGRERRKRKRVGEDDTDFELRIARERSDTIGASRELSLMKTSTAPIVDASGHIDLFGDEKSRKHAEKNEEAEREAAKKKREFEDQYTMRFSNAAGKEGLVGPWYSKTDNDKGDASGFDPPSKDVWGNEDPRRKEREADRLVAHDPLAMMKRGAAKVRELKQERKKAQDEREDELRFLRREERKREKRRRQDKERDRDRDRSRERPNCRSNREKSQSDHRSGDRPDRHRHKEEDRYREPRHRERAR